ncbi:MAG: flagellar basal body rod protein FlgB [Deferribacteraceae bacterium]|jgi:flagellar basal-body rod protein FlgB|nr:flagellar basal body rod protein FlgB [Deferribacteraceae bacterium]
MDMMNGIFNKTRTNDLGFALDTLSVKNTQITRNVANADTPYYRSKKLVFKEVMAEYFSQGGVNKLYVTNEKHIQPFSDPINPKDFVRRQNNPSLRTDGNDVNLDFEMSEQAQSTILYSMLTEMSGSKFATMKEILRTR